MKTDEPRKKLRTDIQGMRAVAVGVVLLYHAGVPFLPGGYIGVDVFFVISGFLITDLLLKEIDESGKISLTGFYARRARRILPAAFVVLAVTSLLSLLFLPRIQWDAIGGQVVASAFNVVNWVFAASEADYLQAGAAASPLQHFWTLAVEEQFYIVWPLLLVGVVALARHRATARGPRRQQGPSRQRLRGFVVLAVLVITVPSLAYSVYLTAANPGPAYFVTTTRMYELGIGAMVAVFATQLGQLRTLITVLLGWAGLACIVASAVLYTAATPFPGAAALLPTLGAAAIIVTGMGGRDQVGVGRVLSLRPMTWAGDISYSLYLWHWPLVVIVGDMVGGLTLPVGLAVVAFSFLPAWASYRYIERPFRKWEFVKPSTKALQVGAAGMLTLSIVGFTPMMVPPVVQAPVPSVTAIRDAAGETEEVEVYGAEALAVDPSVGLVENATGGFTPSVENAASDNPRVYSEGCHRDRTQTEAKACVYGSRSDDYTIAVVGDSHAAHWVPALIRVETENGVRIKSYTKSSCPLTSELVIDPENPGVYTNCLEWGQNVITELKETQPDLVLVSSSTYTSPGTGSFSDGLAGAWKQLQDVGLNVAVLMDTPDPGIDIPVCVARNEDSLSECAVPRDVAYAGGARNAQKEAIEMAGGLPAIDLAASICPAEQCSPVVGGVLVYRDDNHLTATYSETLAPALAEALKKAELL